LVGLLLALSGEKFWLSLGVKGHEDDGAMRGDRKVEDAKAARLASLLIFCGDPYLPHFPSETGDGLADQWVCAE